MGVDDETIIEAIHQLREATKAVLSPTRPTPEEMRIARKIQIGANTLERILLERGRPFS